MAEIVVVGGGGHAKVVISVLKKLRRFRIVGYTDTSDRGDILGVKYIGNDEVFADMVKKFPGLCAAIGIGTVGVSDLRREVMNRISGYGCLFPPIASPDAVVNEDVSLGDGTVVLDGAVVNSGTVVGEGAILNSNCTVEHDCRIGDYVHIAPGATLSGGVEVGDSSMVGAGATIVQYKKVASGCLVGAGATVVEDLTEPGTYVGTPAGRSGK